MELKACGAGLSEGWTQTVSLRMVDSCIRLGGAVQRLYIHKALSVAGSTSASLTAEAIVELFEKDVRARKRLAELLASELDVRLAIVNAVLKDVATKSDIERIRAEYATKEDVKALKEEVAVLRGRVEKIEGTSWRSRRGLQSWRGHSHS